MYTLWDTSKGDVALGTALTQTPSVGQTITNPVLSGGTVDNTTIGGTTPAPVHASALTTTLKGTFVCNGSTPVTVTDANVTANSVIIITLKTVGGTVGDTPVVKTITPTTGFTVAGTASDTSTYNYAIVN